MGYTKRELAAFAEQQRCDELTFQKRWIIMSAGAHYVYADGRYLSPITAKDLAVSLPRDLEAAPVVFTAPMPGGAIRRRNEGEILSDYATVARKIIADMSLASSYYDPATQTFYEAVCAPRAIAPAYDEQIARWLMLLGGAQADKLLDWVATYSDLRRQTCALYLEGPKGCGKTMLATGLARLWGQSPSRLDGVLGNFNSTLVNNPLIFVDETLPESQRRMNSGILRELIGSSARTLKRKFLPDADLLGAIRLIFAANNLSLLNFDEELGPADLEAVAERFLHIKVDARAAEYLRSIGGRDATQGWVEAGDRIAAHALWLRDNREVNPGARFLVEGEITELHRQLATTSGKGRSLVVEFLLRVLLERPRPPVQTALVKDIEACRKVQIGDGKLLVNVNFIQEHWREVMKAQPNPPSTKLIGSVLTSISYPGRQNVYERGGTKVQHKCRSVRADMLVQAAEDLQIGDASDVGAALGMPDAR